MLLLVFGYMDRDVATVVRVQRSRFLLASNARRPPLPVMVGRGVAVASAQVGDRIVDRPLTFAAPRPNPSGRGFEPHSPRL
jgi:hypothetical protein